MLREQFGGRNPSHFHTNPIVKSFITSEILIWSAWNFIAPIFAIFAATQVPGGNIEVAASSFSAHLITRVFFELFSSRFLSKSSDRAKLILSIIGILLLSIGFVGFAFANQVILLYLWYIICGIGIGIASPAKNSLFSMHLDKNKEAVEWGLYDAITFTGIAIAATIGGVIAKQYGFTTLFLLSAIVNLWGIFPYILLLWKPKKEEY